MRGVLNAALSAAALFLCCPVSARAPPPLASLAGAPIAFDRSISRDPPVVSNAWGSVGTVTNDVLSLSQILLPPYLDAGVPTARVTTSGAGAPPVQCTPDTQGPFGLSGSPSTVETFTLRSATDTLRTYDVDCVTPDCTSWTHATATIAAPFNATIDIVFDELPPRAPFSDHGAFSAACTVIQWAVSGGAWTARGGVPVEGWQVRAWARGGRIKPPPHLRPSNHFMFHCAVDPNRGAALGWRCVVRDAHAVRGQWRVAAAHAARRRRCAAHQCHGGADGRNARIPAGAGLDDSVPTLDSRLHMLPRDNWHSKCTRVALVRRHVCCVRCLGCGRF